MGSGSSKISTNKTPPSPTNNNFPVQSNPKFQSSGNSQYRNQWQDQNSNEFYQPNDRNVPGQFSANEPFYDQNNGYPQNQYPQRNQMSQFNPQYGPRVPPRGRVNMNQDIQRSNVIPLSPMEIEELRRKGLQFPPYKDGNMPDRPFCVPCASVGRQPMIEQEEEEYTVTTDEVNMVRSVYDQFCGQDRRMDFQQFSYLYNQDMTTTKKAFAIMDRDKDGLINYDDFLLGYCKTRSSTGPIGRFPERNFSQSIPQRIDHNLPFGPLDEYDPYSTPLEKVAASLRHFAY